MFYFNRKYAAIASLLLAIEVFIAIFIKDGFIRPFIGDVLVVILIYSLLRSFLKTDRNKLAIAVLLFSFTIEILQYFNLVDRLGLRNNRVAAIAIGSTFDWKDLLAYSIGIAIVLWLENRKSRSLTNY
jgi:Protein of unknown function (DUF2809)